MDFIDQIRELEARIPKLIEHIQTEEATKNSLVLPFINILGYDIFDPTEVVPEFTADVGTKKGEKVDYALLMDGKPVILFECKSKDSDLDKNHASQLYRYFSVTEARFGVLTNGIIYRFYSDLEEPNKMDQKPFLEFNMRDVKEPLVDELKKFAKTSFDLDDILTTAVDLKYTTEIKKIIEGQMTDPSDDFVRFFASQVYSGKLTKPVREQFTQLTKKALKQVISDKINDRLKSALAEEVVLSEDEDIPEEDNNKIVTTEEEFEGYYITKTILRDIIDAKRVSIRDTINYCNILLDDNNRKPICRLYFNGGKKHIGLFDEQKKEEKILINDVEDIHKYADRLIFSVNHYDAQKEKKEQVKGYRGSSITSFEFRGAKYIVGSWSDMYIQICTMIAKSHGDQFKEVLNRSGSKRAYFSKNPNNLRGPKLVEGTDIYAETHFSADLLVKHAIEVIELSGYTEDDLSIETQ